MRGNASVRDHLVDAHRCELTRRFGQSTAVCARAVSFAARLALHEGRRLESPPLQIERIGLRTLIGFNVSSDNFAGAN